MGLKLKYVLNTHVHADHITGSGLLKGIFPGCQSVLSAVSTGKADVLLEPFQRITFGSRSLVAVPTPGHTAVRSLMHKSFRTYFGVFSFPFSAMQCFFLSAVLY
jgi:phosphoribosyl 1,2-cyclic phosphodiesterase